MRAGSAPSSSRAWIPTTVELPLPTRSIWSSGRSSHAISNTDTSATATPVADRRPQGRHRRRISGDALYQELIARQGDWADAGIRSVKVIGDACAPGPIAWATYAGHRYARELDQPDIGDALPFRREVTRLA